MAHILAGSWNIFPSVILWGGSPVELVYGRAIFPALYIPALMVDSIFLCPVMSVPQVPPASVATSAQLRGKALGSPAQCHAGIPSDLPCAASSALVTPLLCVNVPLLVSPPALLHRARHSSYWFMGVLHSLTARGAQRLICQCLLLWSEVPRRTQVLPQAKQATSSSSAALMLSASSCADVPLPVSLPILPHRYDHSSFCFLEAPFDHPARSTQRPTCPGPRVRPEGPRAVLASPQAVQAVPGPPALRPHTRAPRSRERPSSTNFRFLRCRHAVAGGGMWGRGPMSPRPQDVVTNLVWPAELR
ncbi:hypothetical protein NDU88_001960 [Pleurodeles waltl]|uniref:Uncharacterized protein n=1 Tax=Pleurodeles waltl TaxID=8319 RepID=A0AAV7L236_PLEWA|nr:hypothetical protein NDU88_001960 [Pleurodeles waltl]